MSVDTSPQTRIIIVDNDPIAREDARQAITKVLPGSLIEEISTEHAFRESLPAFRDTPPQLFIIGTRVRWTDPSPAIAEPPAEVMQEGPLKAGSRLLRELQAAPQTAVVPTVVWGEYPFASPVEGFALISLPGGVRYVPKWDSPHAERDYTITLARAARRALNH